MLLHVKRGLLFVVLQVIHLFLLFFAPFLNNILQQILLNIFVILLLGCTVVLRGYENTLSIAGLIHTSVGRSTGRCWLFEATLQRNSTRKKGFSRALRHDIFNKVLTTYSWFLDRWEPIQWLFIVILHLSFPPLCWHETAL